MRTPTKADLEAALARYPSIDRPSFPGRTNDLDTGILVPPGDPEALGEALTSLLEDESRRRELGAQARLVAEERYSWERIASRLVEIYGSLASPPVAEKVAA